MSDKLPKGWVGTTLGEIVRPGRSRVSPREHPDLPYVGLEHIESHTMRLLGKGDASDVRSSSMLFQQGDVLFGKMRPNLNKVWVAEFDGMCSAEFLVFPHSRELNSAFLALRLNADDFVDFASQQVSGERPRVVFQALSRFPILLPPLTEQGRVVATLNESLSRISASAKAAERASERLAKYRAAVLQAAVTGDLTFNWRNSHQHDETGSQLLKRLAKARRYRWEEGESHRLGDVGRSPKNDRWKSRYEEPSTPETVGLDILPETWVWSALQQIAFIIGGLTKNPRRAVNRLTLPYLRVANVHANELRLEDVATIGVAPEELNRVLLEVGDLLIVEGNGSKTQIGRLAIWDGSIEKCVHQNHIIKVRLVDKSLGKWILFWLLSPPGRHQIEQVASSTTGLYTLNISKVANLPIPLPPLSEQTEIIREVEGRLSAADRLVVKLKSQFDRNRATRQSLMRDAFAGQLVPQDASDEPASALLERIRVTRETEALKPKLQRMPKLTTHVALLPLLDVLRSKKKPISPETLFRESGFQQEFENCDFRQDVVDRFYEELRSITAPLGPVAETRPTRNTVLLEVKS